jgi:hypothetical protein
MKKLQAWLKVLFIWLTTKSYSITSALQPYYFMSKSKADNEKLFQLYQEQERDFAQNFKQQYELQNYIEHPDTDVPGGGDQHIIDKGHWKCRFCGKTKKDGASFKKKAHVLPEQIGNKLIISHSECDVCNERFSNYETHLSEFLGPLKTLLGVKGKPRKGKRIPTFDNPTTGAKITHSEEDILWRIDPDKTIIRLDSPTEISVGELHRPFVPLLVWKGLARTAAHLLDLNELDQFSWFIESVSSDKHDGVLKASKGLCVNFSIFIPSAYNTFPRPELRLFKRKTSGLFDVSQLILPEKIYVLCSSSHIYQIPIFSDNDHEQLMNLSEADNSNGSIPLYPFSVDRKFIEKYDYPKRNYNNLNSTEVETPINWIQFGFENISPITDDKLRRAGLTDDEIRQLKSNGIKHPESLQKFNELLNRNKSGT